MTKAIPLAPSTSVMDPYDLYVPPPPKAGGVPATGRVDPSLKARIAVLTQDSNQPYDTEGDVVRAALHWYFEEKIAPRIGGRFLDDQKRSTLFVRQNQLLARIQAATDFAKKMKKVMLDFAGEEFWDLAIQAWHQAIHHLEGQSEPFRSKAREMLLKDPQLGAVRRRAEEDEVVA